MIEAPLSEVANKEKVLPSEFIIADGLGITEAAVAIWPLIVGKAYPPFENGLPHYVRLQKNVAAPQKLTWELAG